MYRIVKLSGKYYGCKIDDLEDDLENIEIFVSEGTPVILCDEIEDAEDIHFNEVTIVESEGFEED